MKHVLHETVEKFVENFMVFILAASSVHHAIVALSSEQQSKYKDKIYAISGLSFDPYVKNPRKIVQSLLSKDLKDRTEIVVWNDVNDSICRHKSNMYRPLSVPDLINVLKTLQHKLSALVYCQRDRTPDIFDSRTELEKSNSIQVFTIVKDSISFRKRNFSDLLNQSKELHQSSEIDLKKINFILRKEGNFSSITAKSRPKRPRKRAKDA